MSKKTEKKDLEQIEKPKRKYTKKTEKEIAEINNLPAVINPQTLISLAIEKNLDIDKFERLVTLARENEERIAEKLFIEALAKFQSICPVILKETAMQAKDKSTGKKYIRNYYANLGDIIKVVKEPLANCGFSYIVDTEPARDNNHLKVFCIAYHVAGHSKRSEIEIPFDKTEYMNDIQKVTSTQTYAKRLVFCNVFGIMTADKDDDGNYNKPLETGKTKQTINSGADQCKQAYQAIMKVINNDKTILKQDKIKLRKEANEHFENLPELEKILVRLQSKSDPQPENGSEKNITNISDYIEVVEDEPENGTTKKMADNYLEQLINKFNTKHNDIHVITSEEKIKYKRSVDAYIKEKKWADVEQVLSIVDEIINNRTGGSK